jgi:ribosomal protein L3 glutamine methyltransferase
MAAENEENVPGRGMTRLSHNRTRPTSAPGSFAARLPPQPSVQQLIELGAREFERAGLAFGHGTGSPVDDAAALVFHVLGLLHEQAAHEYPRRPAVGDVERVLDAFRARIDQRIPAAYLMGRMWFAGLEFEVDPRVIVPRSPFAELIAAQFAPWVDAASVRRVLDIGTGSGCIAIACALHLPETTVDATDISDGALEVAARNVEIHGLQDRVRLLQGDVFAPVNGLTYDLIVSNPPYVSEAEMTELPAEYHHEPDLALRAGVDGLVVVRRILAGARRHLSPRGILFVEVGDSETRVRELWPRVPFTWLEFEHGGGGVFMLDRAQLEAHDATFATG